MKTCTYFSPAGGEKLGSVLLVHGAGEHFERYQWPVEQMNRAGYDVLGGDLPGYGRSAGKRGHITSFEHYMDAVDEWYRALRKVSSHTPFVMGHSLGGLIVARFMETRKREVKGVILSSPCFGIKIKVPLWKDWISKGLNLIYPTLVLDSGIQHDYCTRSREIAEQAAADPLHTKGVSVRWFRELLLHIEKNWEEQHEFPDVPLAIHQAGHDLVTDAEASKRWAETVGVKDKTYREWPGLYHEILNEPERREVMAEMLNWMDRRRT